MKNHVFAFVVCVTLAACAPGIPRESAQTPPPPEPGWETFENADFSINHPSTMPPNETAGYVGFSHPEGHWQSWPIFIEDRRTAPTLEDTIERSGPFNREKTHVREKITIGGAPAVKVVTMMTNSTYYYRLEQIFVETPTQRFVISNDPLHDRPEDMPFDSIGPRPEFYDFETFYRSFRLK